MSPAGCRIDAIAVRGLLRAAVLPALLGGCGLVTHGGEWTELPPPGPGGANSASSPDAATSADASPAANADGAADDASLDAPDVCVPVTCASAQFNCGTIGDGCGNTQSCGQCSGYDTCGGGGHPFVCGCTPVPCMSGECGVRSDGCGGTIDCGKCGD